MSEPDSEVVKGLDAARRVEREQRDEDVQEELETTAKIADELAADQDGHHGA